MRKTLLIICACMFLGCNSTGRKNRQNLEKITIGMTVNEVYRVMGEPEEMVKWNIDSGFYRLIYEPPFAASDHIYIFIDNSDSVVVGVDKGE